MWGHRPQISPGGGATERRRQQLRKKTRRRKRGFKVGPVDMPFVLFGTGMDFVVFTGTGVINFYIIDIIAGLFEQLELVPTDIFPVFNIYFAAEFVMSFFGEDAHQPFHDPFLYGHLSLGNIARYSEYTSSGISQKALITQKVLKPFCAQFMFSGVGSMSRIK